MIGTPTIIGGCSDVLGSIAYERFILGGRFWDGLYLVGGRVSPDGVAAMSKPTAADRLSDYIESEKAGLREELQNAITEIHRLKAELEQVKSDHAELVRVINSLAHCPVCDALQFGIKQGSQQTHFREDCALAKLQGSKE